MQPLRVSFGGDAEIRTLKEAEWVGGHVMPTGDALLSGYYLNELLLKLLPRHDPHPALYAVYNPMPYEAAREMEVELAIGLREAGYAVWQA